MRKNPSIYNQKLAQKNPINLSIGFQNVEGLHCDGECFLPDISENIKNDIHFLAETWNCNHDKEIPGYQNMFVNGYKTPGILNGRSSGGLLLYVKEHLFKHVKILKNSAYAIWLQVDKNIFTNIDDNLIISAQYVPPVNSKYHNQNSLDTLRTDILNFCDESTPTIFVGDFNSRTGNMPDNLEIDPNLDGVGLEQTEFRPRENCDTVVNTQGKNLIDSIIGKNLRILNGRTSGDPLGNFTTFKNGHHSVNDYGIVSECIFQEIDNFLVFPQTVFSDHAEIVVTIKNVVSPKIDPNGDQEEWYPLGKRQTWNSESLTSLREKLENTSDEQLNSIISLIQGKNNHEAALKLIKIIDNAASRANKKNRKKS